MELILSLWLLLSAPQYDDVVLTAHIVQQEAGNQGFEGKVAVTNVILNRVASDRFPSDVRSVITSRGQFESYETGRYKHVKPDAETYHAVLHGMLAEPVVPEALYFCNYKHIGAKAKRWFDSLEQVDVVGNHTFYK